VILSYKQIACQFRSEVGQCDALILRDDTLGHWGLETVSTVSEGLFTSLCRVIRIYN